MPNLLIVELSDDLDVTLYDQLIGNVLKDTRAIMYTARGEMSENILKSINPWRYPNEETAIKEQVGFRNLTREEGWRRATEIVDSVILQHPLEKYSTGNPFVSGGTMIYTPADQYINHVMAVAEWLLQEENNV